MWFIYISLCIGILIGATSKISKQHNDNLTMIGIFVLLFIMGISIGTNRDVISNIDKVGLIALLYGLFTIGGSIIVVYLLTTFVIRGKRK